MAFYLWPLVWVGGPPAVGPGAAEGDLSAQMVRVERPSFTLRADRDGLFTLVFASPAEQAEDESFARAVVERQRTINAFLATLLTAVRASGRPLLPYAVTPSAIFTRSSIDGAFFSYRDQHLGWMLDARLVPPDRRPLDERFSRPESLAVDVIELAAARFAELLERDEQRLVVLSDLVVRAAVAHDAHDHEGALTNAWFVCENLVQVLWDRYIAANRQRDGVSFINARNGWVHSLRPVASGTAADAIDLAQTLLELVAGVHLRRRVAPTLSA